VRKPPLISQLLLGCVLLAAPAAAESGSRFNPLNQLLRGVEYAFSGNAISSHSVADSSTGYVLTRVVFRNLQIVYGEAPGDSIEAMVLGGVGAGHTDHLEPVRLDIGSRYVLLLGKRRPGRRGLEGVLVGSSAGIFRVAYGEPGGGSTVTTLAGIPVISVTEDAIEVLERVNAWPGSESNQRVFLMSPIRGVASTRPTVEALSEQEFLDILSTRIPAAKALPLRH
jgi:hypothetical protein